MKDNKFFRYCTVEPRCRLRMMVLSVLLAVIVGQLCYQGLQVKRLGTAEAQAALISRTADMEKELRSKARLEAFRNDEDDALANVKFTRVSGIAVQKGVPSVLIDDTVYSEGDVFGDYIIVNISEDLITLVNKKTNAIKNLYIFE